MPAIITDDAILSGANLRRLELATGAPVTAADGRDGVVVTADLDGWVAVVPEEAAQSARWRAHEGPVNAVVLLPDGLLSTGDDQRIRLWRSPFDDVPEQTITLAFPALRLASNADGSVAVVSGRSGLVQMWDLKGAKVIGEWDSGAAWITSLFVDWNEELIITGAADSRVCLWRFDRSAPLRCYTDPSHWITGVALCDDHVVAGSLDGALYIWPLEGLD